MSWPAYLWTQQAPLGTVNRVADRAYRHVKSIRDVSAAGDTLRTQFEALVEALNNHLALLGKARQVPGIAAYAQAQLEQVVGLDPVAEFQAMESTMVALRDWMQTRLDNNPGVSSFNTGQTAQFRTNADAFLATIDITAQ